MEAPEQARGGSGGTNNNTNNRKPGAMVGMGRWMGMNRGRHTRSESEQFLGQSSEDLSEASSGDGPAIGKNGTAAPGGVRSWLTTKRKLRHNHSQSDSNIVVDYEESSHKEEDPTAITAALQQQSTNNNSNHDNNKNDKSSNNNEKGGGEKKVRRRRSGINLGLSKKKMNELMDEEDDDHTAPYNMEDILTAVPSPAAPYLITPDQARKKKVQVQRRKSSASQPRQLRSAPASPQGSTTSLPSCDSLAGVDLDDDDDDSEDEDLAADIKLIMCRFGHGEEQDDSSAAAAPHKDEAVAETSSTALMSESSAAAAVSPETSPEKTNGSAPPEASSQQTPPRQPAAAAASSLLQQQSPYSNKPSLLDQVGSCNTEDEEEEEEIHLLMGDDLSSNPSTLEDLKAAVAVGKASPIKKNSEHNNTSDEKETDPSAGTTPETSSTVEEMTEDVVADKRGGLYSEGRPPDVQRRVSGHQLQPLPPHEDPDSAAYSPRRLVSERYATPPSSYHQRDLSQTPPPFGDKPSQQPAPNNRRGSSRGMEGPLPPRGVDDSRPRAPPEGSFGAAPPDSNNSNNNNSRPSQPPPPSGGSRQPQQSEYYYAQISSGGAQRQQLRPYMRSFSANSDDDTSPSASRAPPPRGGLRGSSGSVSFAAGGDSSPSTPRNNSSSSTEQPPSSAADAMRLRSATAMSPRQQNSPPTISSRDAVPSSRPDYRGGSRPPPSSGPGYSSGGPGYSDRGGPGYSDRGGPGYTDRGGPGYTDRGPGYSGPNGYGGGGPGYGGRPGPPINHYPRDDESDYSVSSSVVSPGRSSKPRYGHGEDGRYHPQSPSSRSIQSMRRDEDNLRRPASLPDVPYGMAEHHRSGRPAERPYVSDRGPDRASYGALPRPDMERRTSDRMRAPTMEEQRRQYVGDRTALSRAPTMAEQRHRAASGGAGYHEHSSYPSRGGGGGARQRGPSEDYYDSSSQSRGGPINGGGSSASGLTQAEEAALEEKLLRMAMEQSWSESQGRIPEENLPPPLQSSSSSTYSTSGGPSSNYGRAGPRSLVPRRGSGGGGRLPRRGSAGSGRYREYLGEDDSHATDAATAARLAEIEEEKKMMEMAIQLSLQESGGGGGGGPPNAGGGGGGSVSPSKSYQTSNSDPYGDVSVAPSTVDYRGGGSNGRHPSSPMQRAERRDSAGYGRSTRSQQQPPYSPAPRGGTIRDSGPHESPRGVVQHFNPPRRHPLEQQQNSRSYRGNHSQMPQPQNL